MAGALTIPALIVLVMGIQGVISGVVYLVLAFKGGGLGAGVLGVLSIVFGVILVLNFANLGAIVALVWVTGIFALVGGLVGIVLALVGSYALAQAMGIPLLGRPMEKTSTLPFPGMVIMAGSLASPRSPPAPENEIPASHNHAPRQLERR